MADYEFFKKEFEFRGKHARMVSELWVANDYKNTYFKRLVDLYILAAVIGIRVDRREEEDYSPFEPKSIFPEQMMKAKEDLDFIMQMMLMLENAEELSKEERVKLAFRGPESKEEYERYYNLFNSYVRGGVEELYDRLVVHKSDAADGLQDEKTENLIELLERFGMEKNVKK